MSKKSVHDRALPSFLDGPPKNLFIDGQWAQAESAKVFDSVNPSTGERIAQLAEGDAADVDRAVAAARRAFDGPWSKSTPVQRQNVLLRLAELIEHNLDELRVLDVVDMGMPISRGVGNFAADTLRYFAGLATQLHGETIPNSVANTMFTYTMRRPVGVVGAIIPWNSPLSATLWKLAPALATGCTIVLKPAEEAALTPLRIGELVEQLDLPPGVVNIVTGFGNTAGAALARHHDVDKVAFTGSTAVGQEIVRAAAGNLKRVSLELGGKSPDIVFADADLDIAVPGVAMGVFANSGQICCAGTRVYVEDSIYEHFVERMTTFAQSLRVGNSMESATQIGPLVSAEQLDRVVRYLALGHEQGARATAGGGPLRDEALAGGFFVPPTVFADVRDDMSIAQDEIFGPVASVLRFGGIEEVVQRSNSTVYGLGAGIWTRDVGKAHSVARALNTGVVWINTYGNFDPAIPFGGTKMSGWGRELGAHSVADYLDVKSVWINAAT